MSNPFKSYRGEYRSDKSGSAATAMVKAHIRQVMLELASDPLSLAEVVGAGPAHWRALMIDAFHPYPLPDGVPEQVFRFFCAKLTQHFGVNEFAADSAAYETAKAVLDTHEPETGPTPEQIRDGWKVEDFSSPDGLRTVYGSDDPGKPAESLAKLAEIDYDKDRHGETTKP